MMKKKLNQIREHAARIDSKLLLVETLHDDNLFNHTKIGKQLIELINNYHDINLTNTTHHIKKALKHSLIKQDSAEITPWINEIDYLRRVSKAIAREKHSCKYFKHFIENFNDFLSHLDDSTSFKFKEHENLLRSIYHKDNPSLESYHFAEYELKEIPLLQAIKHKIFGTKFKDEHLIELSKLLEDRSNWLLSHAQRQTKKILNKKIKDININREIWKRKTAKFLDRSIEHHEDLSKFFEVWRE